MQLTSPLLYPTPHSKDFLNSTNRILLSSAAQYIGECFVVPKSGTVTKVGFLSSDGAGLTGSPNVNGLRWDVSGDAIKSGGKYGLHRDSSYPRYRNSREFHLRKNNCVDIDGRRFQTAVSSGVIRRHG